MRACVRMSVCKFAYIHVNVSIWVCVCVRAYTRARACVYACVRVAVRGEFHEWTGRCLGRSNGKSPLEHATCGPALAAPSSALAGGRASLAGSPDDECPVQGQTGWM